MSDDETFERLDAARLRGIGRPDVPPAERAGRLYLQYGLDPVSVWTYAVTLAVGAGNEPSFPLDPEKDAYASGIALGLAIGIELDREESEPTEGGEHHD